MPRSKSDIVSPELAESLRLEVAELLDRRAELEALLQFPLTVESMNKKREDLDAEFEKLRFKAWENHEIYVVSLKALAEGELKTLEAQKVRLQQEQTSLGDEIKKLEKEVNHRLRTAREINDSIMAQTKALGQLRTNCELAEDILKQKGVQMNALMEEFHSEVKKLEAERDSLERTKAELKAKDHNLANLQTVLNLQLAEARERLTEVEKREQAVAAAHAQNCLTYNDLIAKATAHEEAYAEKSRRMSHHLLFLESEERKLRDKEADLVARERDLTTNWEVFKKEKAKHEWATRGQ